MTTDIAQQPARALGARVLVIAAASTCDSIEETLREAGHVVISVKDGTTALERYRVHLPDLVLVDLEKPIQHGLETIRVLRGEFPEGRIIAFSGASRIGERDTRSAARTAGALLFLPKPICRGTLLASVDIALRLAPLPSLDRQPSKAAKLVTSVSPLSDVRWAS